MPLSRAQRVQVRRLSEGLTTDRSILNDTTAAAGFKTRQWRVTSVGMEDAISRLTELPEIASDTVNQLIGEESRKTVQAIKLKWPVDTGASRSRWNTTRVRQGRVTRWVIANDIPYLNYIHRSGNPALLVDTLVPDEMAELRSRINSRLSSLIRQRLKGKANAAVRNAALSLL